MFSEPVKIMIRRFRDRQMESGLLIIAIALGIGATAAGFSLLVNTNAVGTKMLSSPAYREIIVSTHDEASEMENPAEIKPIEENTVLTDNDLTAAEIIPSVSYAYVANDTNMLFLTQQRIERMSQRQPQQPQQNEAQPQQNEAQPQQNEAQPQDDPMAQRLEEMKQSMEDAEGDSSIIMPQDLDELRGMEVTPEFFDAREIQAVAGSLFTQSDILSTENYVVLGYNTAARLAEETGDLPAALIGKKILETDGLHTIIGILEASGESWDDKYFAPYKNAAAQAGAADFRQGPMDTALIFSVSDPEELTSTATLLAEWFVEQFGEGQVVISNPREEAQQLINRNRGISYLIMFLAVAGLFIASVNVSNILMGRALRMKKHVGILKALGASRRKILNLFAGEALGVTVSGALLGAAMAFPLTGIMQSALDMPGSAVLPIFAGVGISWILTLSLTILPALQNSQIEAAEAMRAA